jgi:ABC-2 type transport system permease protein
MGIRKLMTLLGKELLHGPRGFILIMVVAAPLLITLVVNLALGDLFSGIPQLAVYDEGNSRLLDVLKRAPQIELKYYNSTTDLKNAVDRGAADMGIVLPYDLDTEIQTGQQTTLTLYTWGESMAKDRLVVVSTLMQAVRDYTGQQVPITLETVALGSESAAPWSQRLMPLTIMMAVFFGGLMMPAVSLINEKQKRTLQALAATPVSILNILIAKGIVGALLSMIMGILILLLNQAWGNSPLYLILTLIMAAVMSAETGLILGTMIKDINTLFAVWKFGGLLIFGPAIIYMFPGLPQWIGYLFPTYYIIRPIMDISMGTANMVTLWLSMIGVAFLIILALVQVRLAGRFTAERMGSGPAPAEA